MRDFYKRLLNFTINSSALAGNYQDIHLFNRENTENYNDKVLSFVRWSTDEKLIVVSNFDAEKGYGFNLKIPKDLIETWNLKDGNYKTNDV
uniref:alpha amylase C-terminal domain-containing protein n=1 Tax=Mariniflexile sp. TaxID=1979402 RepID=UPI0040473477